MGNLDDWADDGFPSDSLTGREAAVILYDSEIVTSLVSAQRATPFAAFESWTDTVCESDSGCNVSLA